MTDLNGQQNPHINNVPLVPILSDGIFTPTKDIFLDTVLIVLMVGIWIFLGYDTEWIGIFLRPFPMSILYEIYENYLGTEKEAEKFSGSV